MIPATKPPEPDELVETLFAEVLLPPDGYEYYSSSGQLLFPVFGQDQWRILLLKRGTTDGLVPVFLEGPFIRTLMKTLHAMQRELNKSVEEKIMP